MRPALRQRLWWLTLAALLVAPAQAQDAAAWLLLRDGVVVQEHAADVPLPMASLAKMMTALLALESGRDLGEQITVVPAAARETGTRLPLKTGERTSLQELLAATVIASANDACHALAAVLAGDEARFVARMNARAAALGLAQTHYQNACGHDAPGQHSSARDVARLALLLMRDARYRALARASEGVLHVTAPKARTLRFGTTNLLIGRYKGAVGIKTGTTPAAGKCLAAFALRGEHSALLVLLNAPDRWWTATDLLDVAFGSHSTTPREALPDVD